jgi:hypothetical protein
MLLAEMIDRREENMDKEFWVQKALTFGIKIPEKGVDKEI